MTLPSLTDSLVKTALVGTGERAEIDTTTGTMLDSLSLPADDQERQLLLKAGARSIYAMAGYMPATLAAPETAGSEELPVCSPEVAELLKEILGASDDQLQILAFQRMRHAQQVLAPQLLPAVLDERNPEKRRLLRPLLGRRGVWLSRFNTTWVWASELPATSEDTVPENAQALWRDGATSQRSELLRQVRASDPGLAREWIQAAWKREKAELRAEFVHILKIGLGAADEPILEQALDDKAGMVRSAAAEVLRGLTNSALAARMLERADSLLTWSSGALRVNLPSTMNAAWQRDGIDVGGAPHSRKTAKGDQTRVLIQILSYVSPQHWEERFNLGAQALIAAAGQTRWESALLEGWTSAAAFFGVDPWILALKDRWERPSTDPSPGHEKDETWQRARDMYAVLAPKLPQALQEAAARLLIQGNPSEIDLSLHEALGLLNRPWSPTLADEYLQGLRAYVAQMSEKSVTDDPWSETFHLAVTGLPAESLAEAGVPLKVSVEKPNWYIQQFQRQLDEFVSHVQLRARIEKEIHQ